MSLINDESVIAIADQRCGCVSLNIIFKQLEISTVPSISEY